jgi:hypothetical protein
MVFTGAGPVLDYLPASGGPGSLNADLVDPSSTSSGIFGGFVLALQFDVDFTDSGVITGSAGIPFGDLVLHDLIATPLFNGFSVQQFLGWANDALGGTVPPYTFDDLAILIRDVTDAFEGGTPTQFAQDHLRIAGDFNGDGAVDAADYVVWRKNNGSVAQYNEWRANFGQPTGSGSHSATGTAVPEPATRALILLSALALACRRAGRI